MAFTAEWGFLVAVALVLYQCSVVIYRLYFHRLARFPGPKLAAATGWYEAFFDLARSPGGSPIVRVNPHEIHVEDSAWVDSLYSGLAGGPRDKYPPAAHMTGTPNGGKSLGTVISSILLKTHVVFGTISSEIHRRRRNAISSIFAKSTVAMSEELMYKNVDLLLQRMHSQIKATGSTEMRTNYLALATDILSDHCLGQSTDFLLDDQEATKWRKTINAIATLTPLAKQFPFIIPFALRLPLWPLEMVVPDLARIVRLRRVMDDWAKQAVSSHTSGESGIAPDEKQTPDDRPNIFRTVLASKKLDEPEKRYGRIAQEAFVALVAGGETTARALTIMTYHVLANREKVLPRLLEELRTVMPSGEERPSLAQLECLPWLNAIIKESLRINALVTSRLPLVSPKAPLIYKDWMIPPGTPVSMTLRDILLDPDVYPEPLQFKPERWLVMAPDGQRMNHNYVPFGRGSRMCLANENVSSLALSELYIVTASLFRREDFILHDTIRERDVDIVRDCFIGEVSTGTKGVRIRCEKR
ncbi:hypothetical protein PG984_012247 [Apiospora sp. TS-2023a]